MTSYTIKTATPSWLNNPIAQGLPCVAARRSPGHSDMGEQQLSKEEVVVAVRLRPLLGPEKERGEREAWSTGFCTLTQITIPEKQHSEAPPATFAYDHVFGTAEANEVGQACLHGSPRATSWMVTPVIPVCLQAIYQAVAEKLVHSTVLEGLHSCLFAYGEFVYHLNARRHSTSVLTMPT
jgi:hypothetical protein